MNTKPNGFCTSCGTEYQTDEWPRDCLNCGHRAYKNPLPVAVILQPIYDQGRIGLLKARRAIQPCLGQWALVGGFMEDNGESAEVAALRELREETGIVPSAAPVIMSSAGNGKGQLLIVCRSLVALPMRVVENAILSPENYEVGVMWEPEDLAFPIHTQAVEAWFRYHAGDYDV